VRSLLVLWDVDHTLVDSGGVGSRLYHLVFRDLFGRDLPGIPPVAGRTERAIIPDMLALAGIPKPRQHVDEFIARMVAIAPALGELTAARGRAMPGVAAALAAVAAHPALTAVQSVLTGNLRAMAEVKLGAFKLTEHLDLDIGAYGDVSDDRADLVQIARSQAGRAYDHDFAGEATVLVGDTPLDMAAALASGARAIGVATGVPTAGELTVAGAHTVLPDLTNTAAVVETIVGFPGE